MDIGSINTLISGVGFPIACFLMCAWYVKYREDKNDEKLDKINATHDEENRRMVEALENNTEALNKLSLLIGKE